MKSNLIMMLVTTLLVVMSLGQSAIAQDFDALLEAVDKIENNLKNLIKQEATIRSRQLAELKSAIAKNQKSAKGHVTGGVTDKQLADVIHELSVLHLQVVELEKYFDKNGTQYASLDHAGSPAAGHHKPAKTHHSSDKHSKTTVNGKLYSHVFTNISNNEGSHSEFALSRAYLTVRSKISDYASIRVTTDLKTIDDKYNIILKYAYFDWKPAFTKGIVGLRFGLQPTEYIDYMNKLWGRRYAAATIGDLHHFLTSSDLGVSTTVGFGPKAEFGFVKLAMLNGTSYTHVQEHNSRKDFSFVTLLTPFKGSHDFKNTSFLMQFYSGTQNESLDDIVTTDTSMTPWDTTVTTVTGSDWKRQLISVGGAFVWNHTVDFGFDLNFLTLGKGASKSAVKKQGLSIFGAYYLYRLSKNVILKNLAIIGRLDLYDPDKGKDNNSETLTVFGIESKPVYSFKVALNYRITSYEDDAKDTNSMLFLNTLFKF